MSGGALGVARQKSSSTGRNSIQDLLHALNQPLTGLQCALELAAAAPQSLEFYQRTLRDALQLTGRMRVLVEGLRELTEAVFEPPASDLRPVSIEKTINALVSELQPVAEGKSVQLRMDRMDRLSVLAPERNLNRILFRLLDSVLSLAHDQSVVQLWQESSCDVASIAISWRQGRAQAQETFCRAEIGLLISRLDWEQAGGQWTERQTDENRICTLAMPLVSTARPE